jgi:hypothetical protein
VIETALKNGEMYNVGCRKGITFAETRQEALAIDARLPAQGAFLCEMQCFRLTISEAITLKKFGSSTNLIVTFT